MNECLLILPRFCLVYAGSPRGYGKGLQQQRIIAAKDYSSKGSQQRRIADTHGENKYRRWSDLGFGSTNHRV
ncbi:hypothetical protein BJ166DRAFT_537591 [Pestalotiopsis sp. NC0098]|nr:hypothetical protein BJ166DRAFT_537591 [Pestalotiopsis sp. NC0098]